MSASELPFRTQFPMKSEEIRLFAEIRRDSAVETKFCSGKDEIDRGTDLEFLESS